MTNRELSRQLQAIRSLFDRTDDACSDDVEMRSHWARYLCVLSAGFIENALKEVFGDIAKRSSSPAVANFTVSSLSQIRNPKTSRFLEVAGSFKKTWREELEQYVDAEGRREAIDSIMQNRHQIAHGQLSSITIVRVKEYLSKSVAVIAFMEKQCNT